MSARRQETFAVSGHALLRFVERIAPGWNTRDALRWIESMVTTAKKVPNPYNDGSEHRLVQSDGVMPGTVLILRRCNSKRPGAYRVVSVARVDARSGHLTWAPLPLGRPRRVDLDAIMAERLAAFSGEGEASGTPMSKTKARLVQALDLVRRSEAYKSRLVGLLTDILHTSPVDESLLQEAASLLENDTSLEGDRPWPALVLDF